MVTCKREIRLWREAHPVQRALMIRDDAEAYWIACQMRHGLKRHQSARIVTAGHALAQNIRRGHCELVPDAPGSAWPPASSRIAF
jgi:hypothetical protein